MSTAFLSPSSHEDVDEIVDLTDRRRVFLHAVFGVEVPPDAIDALFDVPDEGDEPGVIDLR